MLSPSPLPAYGTRPTFARVGQHLLCALLALNVTTAPLLLRVVVAQAQPYGHFWLFIC